VPTSEAHWGENETKINKRVMTTGGQVDEIQLA